MIAFTELLSMRCRPLDGGAPMSTEEISAQLNVLPGWREHEGAIERRFVFADFYQSVAFVNALAWIAHREDHHPDLAVSYASVTVRFNTHSVGGISINDFICAAQVQALVAPRAA